MVNQLLPVTLSNAQIKKRGKSLIGPVSTELRAKGITVVIGANGSGKTSLLRMLNGLDRLSGGSIDWSCDVEFARQSQALVFQTPIVLRRTALANLIYPLVINGASRKKAETLAKEWLDRTSLTAVSGLEATQLSGGEKQKLAIIRALITGPQLLILDEPTANLDGRATREIESLLLETYASGTKILLSTHDMGQAKRLADDVLFLHRGKIHEQAQASNFFDSPDTSEAKSFLRGDIVE